MRRRSWRVVVICVALSSGPGWAVDPPPAVDPAVADAVRPLVDGKPSRAAAVAVVTPTGTRTFGFGTVTVDGKVGPPDERTEFEIGSVTKVMTGTLLARLVIEKKVRLDDPVRPLLPADWDVPRRDDRDVTLLHLATHTSGLPVQPPTIGLFAATAGTPGDPYSKFDAKALAWTLGRLRIDRPIGARFEYSNLGVGLLGHALARAAGVDSYDAALADRVLRPLGLTDTAVKLPADRLARLAPGHDAAGKPVPGWTFATLEACGGVRSTAADLARFLTAAMDPAKPSLGPAFALAQQPWRELPGDDEAVGLCWMRSGVGRRLTVWHNGGTGGFATYLGFRPATGVGVVVLCNAADRKVDGVGAKVLDVLAK